LLENFELEYWQLLIVAIEKYTVRNISNNRYYYYYDNIDFTYAVQKRLYFDILSQDKYSVDIKKYLSHGCSKIIYVKNETHKNILDIMYQDYNLIFRVSKDIKEFSKSIILQNRFLINGTLRFFKKNYLSDTAQYNSAFLIIHHKFIYFFDEINKKLDNTLFIIISDVNKSIQLCKEKKYKIYSTSKKCLFIKTT